MHDRSRSQAPPEVQNMGISDPIRRTNVLQLFLNKNTEKFLDYQVHETFRRSIHFTTGIFV